ncbi:MAG: glycerate 2-kinase, partial [Candidatus Hydrogenedentes bacterium]|nr:glycerate 2-kinase [Candidatus Hydrogenedentota bacterium]
FKECASAGQVAEAVAMGVRRAAPDAEVVCVPMADGGEGTVDALVMATSGTLVERRVMGPMGESVLAAYGILGDGGTAVIEMAAASGLALVSPTERDPRTATTRGTGELMRDALDRGVCRMILGIGGSATNDGGAGMAQALGYSLRDARGEELGPGGAALADLAVIDDTRRHPGLAACEVLVACDVDNPLCGPTGASLIYGPQKGATPPVACALDEALRYFGETVEAQLGKAILDLPGSGAAGGLGGGLVAFCGAKLVSGVELVAEACGLARHVAGADLVITGEGALDRQTASGKTPVGVARVAKAYGVPVVALAGKLGADYRVVYDHGIDAAFSVVPGPETLDYAVEHALAYLADTAEAVMRLWLMARR